MYKKLLPSSLQEEIINIKDEYILDRYIIKYKDKLDWNSFLSSLILKYNNEALYKSIKEKVKSILTISYSQIFQIKQYYNKKFIEMICKNTPYLQLLLHLLMIFQKISILKKRNTNQNALNYTKTSQENYF